MAYTDVPLSPQRFKDSQPEIRQNFVEINNLINVDHYTFGSPTVGEHKKVTLPDQGVPAIFPGNDIGLWAQIPTANPLTLINELFVRRQDGTQTNITGKGIGPSFWTYLPSGILIKWGAGNVAGAGTVVYPVAGNIPAFNGAPFVTFTQVLSAAIGDPNAAVTVIAGATYTNLSFDVFCSERDNPGTATPAIFLWITIGL